MKNRHFLIVSVAAVFLLGSCQNQHEQPNIIYILADDLGYGDTGCYGQELFATPNIDRLATEGMRFTRHYSGSTVCAPSRSALLTGLHTGHTPVRGNKEIKPEGQWPLPDTIKTLSSFLRDAGYKTGAFGKWGLGFTGTEGDPNNQGFDEFFGYNCQRMAHNYYPWHLWHNNQKVILEGNMGSREEEYAPEIIHQKALEFMEENRENSFFLYYAAVLPHAELKVPEQYMAAYRGRFLPEKAYQGTDDGPNYKVGGYGSQPESHAAFAGMISFLDETVGSLMNKLEELGIAEQTIVFFTSDNGPHLEGGADPTYFNSNAGLRGFKRDLYEGGIRVPLLVRWPGKIEPASVSDHIGAFWDMFPTFAELTGQSPPAGLDGISMLPELLGRGKQKKHDYLYWEFHEGGARVALLKEPWKAVRYNVNEDPNSILELYHLGEDPAESINVADQHPDILKALDSLIRNSRTTSKIYVSKGLDQYSGQ